MSPNGSQNNRWNKVFTKVAAERSELSQPKFEEHSYFLGMGLHLKNQEILKIGVQGEKRFDILRKLLIKHDNFYSKYNLSEISEDSIKSRLKVARKRLIGKRYKELLRIIYKIGKHNSGTDKILAGNSLKLDSNILSNASSFKSMIEFVYDYSAYTEDQRAKLVDYIDTMDDDDQGSVLA
jgi:hypothetical protein